MRTLVPLAIATALLACSDKGASERSEATAPDRVEPAAKTAAAQPPAPTPAVRPLKIGVTLHPYYSWTKNVAGDLPGIEVVPILPGDVDAGNYQPSSDDIKKLADLDAIVVNGIGHDDFVGGMVKASGNDKVALIQVNQGTPTVKSAHGDAPNSHTFISFTNAIQQTYAIEKKLAELRPDLADRLHANAAAYADKLRAIKAAAASQLAAAKIKRVVTVHDGYSYLLQEFGIELAGVVEPSHGLVPSAKELGEMIDLIKKEKIAVVFSEESFPDKLLATLRESTGAKVYIISHIAVGEYAADEFEKGMKANADVMVKALVTDPK